MADKISTEKNIERYLKKKRNVSVREICIDLRLMPSTVREALRDLYNKKVIEKERKGRKIIWKHV